MSLIADADDDLNTQPNQRRETRNWHGHKINSLHLSRGPSRDYVLAEVLSVLGLSLALLNDM